MKILSEFEKEISKQVADFLKSHPLISKNALEKMVGIPQGQLAKAINEEKPISPKHLFAVIRMLGHYGLQLDGFRVIPDDSTPHIFLVKDIEEEPEIIEESEGVFMYKQKQSRSIACDLYDLL